MKNNKGFTLIELLAVIVILAVIALIATPLVLNVITEARQGAAENSAYGYARAVENSVQLDVLHGSAITFPTTVDHDYATVNGLKPTEASITVSNDQVITAGYIVMENEYIIVFDNATGEWNYDSASS